ncbi:MAG: cysteine desulfurase [Defluviitaleaceae bacterium]|nr:cysteine desulfurase [Defluviitaleaceae bacterium]
MENHKIYLDNAATTKILESAYHAMLPYFGEYFANPGGLHKMASDNRRAIAGARKTIADAIGATEREIYFTSGGTEADNWAIKGIADTAPANRKHIITTSIEHKAVMHTCEYLQRYRGFSVTYLPVCPQGTVNTEDLRRAITPQTALISVMFANNETGVLQPIKEIGEIAREHDIIFHTDGVQALGYVPIDVSELNIDMLSISSHKIYGPKGIGVLYVKDGIPIAPLLHGGNQERNRRAGTENVPGIIGFATALETVRKDMEEEARRLFTLTQLAIEGMLAMPLCRLNGDKIKRLPHIFNVSFENVDPEILQMLLDKQGIVVAGGAACTSGTDQVSHVLLAMGLDERQARGAIRISLGRYNTENHIKTLLAKLPPILEKLRNT